MSINDEEKRQIMKELARGNPEMPNQEQSHQLATDNKNFEAKDYQNFDDFAQRSSHDQRRQVFSQSLHPDKIPLSQIEPELFHAIAQIKPNERDDVARAFFKHLKQRGLSESDLERQLGLSTHNPNCMTADDVSKLAAFAYHTHPDIFQDVLAAQPAIVRFFTHPLFGAALGALVQVGGAVGSTTLVVGKAVMGATSGVGETAAKQTHHLIEQATQGAGQAINHVSDNWLVRKVAGVLNLNWLVGATDRVDMKKAEATVRKLQQQHPTESPSQIAHRLMLKKAAYAGGIGLASSILPGVAVALLAVDLAATTQLQAEMVYQIAAAYGFDSQDPARKGEVLAIFGLALGGGRVLKELGLGLLRNVPFAGAMIGASTNATMLYSLGYAACRFYEAKLDSPTSITTDATLADLKKQSENYIETASVQEAVMDQILAHMILAGHPEKSWSEILPELQALQLSPNALEVIATNIKSPQPLNTLLNQLNRDFAVPLLAQCYRIAQLDGDTTPAEATLIATITSKFDIDLSLIRAAVSDANTSNTGQAHI